MNIRCIKTCKNIYTITRSIINTTSEQKKKNKKVKRLDKVTELSLVKYDLIFQKKIFKRIKWQTSETSKRGIIKLYNSIHYFHRNWKKYINKMQYVNSKTNPKYLYIIKAFPIKKNTH